jgi:hypothetical protein
MTDLNTSPDFPFLEESLSIQNPYGGKKTSETSETYTFSNQDFLTAIFGSESHEARPILVSFTGSPNITKKSAWKGEVWLADQIRLFQVKCNNYFSLATFSPDGEGLYRRRKEQFAALYALMLDDIGTKADIERLTLPPTWLIETSPGNHQAGYVFVNPVTDLALAERLMKAIIAAGLSDPGSTGPSTRLARLPVGCNSKHAPPFVCRLVEWHPDRRYTLEQLMSAYGAARSESKSATKVNSSKVAKPKDADQMKGWVPRADTNRVIEKLQSFGIYKNELGNGKHDIRCPWISEHTGHVDSGTAYFEPDHTYPAGGFKCLHGHCADRHLSELLKHLGLEMADAGVLPTIRVVPGKLSAIVDAAEQVLAQSLRYFQRGGLIVTVLKDASCFDIRIQEVSEADLLKELANSITWERLDGKSDKFVIIDPPNKHVTTLFKASSFQNLPPLLGITRQPYLRADGSLIREPGYDRASMMFGAFDPNNFSIPENPTRSDVQAARSLLESLLEEFTFQDNVDKAAALSAILTAAIRPSLPFAPAFHVRAHTAGSGKSYLCELISMFSTSQPSAPAAFPTENDECRKFLLAELLRGPAVITFDNLTSDLLAHRSLCTALTSEFLSDRILGISKTATVSTRTLFLCSGNNVGPIKDMTRRTVTINLDPGVESPATRNFKRPNLIQEVRENRPKYVSAALTLILARIQSNQPRQLTRTLAGFTAWTDWCVEPVLQLGYPDPISSVVAAMAADPDKELLGRILNAWYEQFGSAPTMVREVVDKVGWAHDNNADLKEAIHEFACDRGEINRRKLGWWIRRHEGQVVNGKRFRRTDSAGSAEKWRVEVLEVSPVSFAAPDDIGMKDCDEYRRMSRGG